jgi:hypothetical protein
MTWFAAGDDSMDVAVSLVEGALVFICHPGIGNDNSLFISFPKFAQALEALSKTLWDEAAFFLCLSSSLLRHKAKLPKATRDAVVKSWQGWLRYQQTDKGSVATVAHKMLIHLLNDWASLGNILLPRDTLVEFSLQTVKAANASVMNDAKNFAQLWKEDTGDFLPVKKEY